MGVMDEFEAVAGMGRDSVVVVRATVLDCEPEIWRRSSSGAPWH